MYAVFGVTKKLALKRAISHINRKGWDTKKHETYDEALTAKVAQLLEKSSPVQLSCTYSNKAQAEQYKALAVADGANSLQIKRREASGRMHPKTKKEIITWVSA